MAKRLNARFTAGIALLIALGFVVWRLSQAAWDPLGLAEIGTRYSQLDPNGAEGYDGQFAYYIASSPDPHEVEAHLDVPAYRYQRILYPLTARALALGNQELIPWTLILLNLAAITIGTWAVAKWLMLIAAPAIYALPFGLWVGLVGAAGTDLNEPLAYALIACAWLARESKQYKLAALFLALSLFAKETSMLFFAAVLIEDVMRKRWRESAGWLGVGIAIFLTWQVWLYATFGRPGIGAGGAMATPFEWIPFMGLVRIGQSSPGALGLFLAIFGPTIVVPVIWGTVASLRDILRKTVDTETWALLLNATAMVFLPFSTFREPLGLVRIASGLVLATIYYTARRGHKRAQNYSLFWMAMLAMLIRS
jgi:hypothetical protein